MVKLAREPHDDGKKPGAIAAELRVSRTTIYSHVALSPLAARP